MSRHQRARYPQLLVPADALRRTREYLQEGLREEENREPVFQFGVRTTLRQEFRYPRFRSGQPRRSQERREEERNRIRVIEEPNFDEIQGEGPAGRVEYRQSEPGQQTAAEING